MGRQVGRQDASMGAPLSCSEMWVSRKGPPMIDRGRLDLVGARALQLDLDALPIRDRAVLRLLTRADAATVGAPDCGESSSCTRLNGRRHRAVPTGRTTPRHRSLARSRRERAASISTSRSFGQAAWPTSSDIAGHAGWCRLWSGPEGRRSTRLIGSCASDGRHRERAHGVRRTTGGARRELARGSRDPRVCAGAPGRHVGRGRRRRSAGGRGGLGPVEDSEDGSVTSGQMTGIAAERRARGVEAVGHCCPARQPADSCARTVHRIVIRTHGRMHGRMQG